MCGICGIIHTQSCEHEIENQLSKSLRCLRHRGYDGCGISINLPYKKILSRRRIVSTQQFIQQIQSEQQTQNHSIILNKKCKCDSFEKNRICGIAHTRYKTAGECSLNNTQPVFNKNETIALVHNGQIEVSGVGDEKNKSIFDSKYILDVFDRAFSQTKSIFKSINIVHDTIKGAYSCVLMIKDLGIVGFRDPNGIRPLVFGINKNNKDLELFDEIKNVESAIFASESVVSNRLGFNIVRDVCPGESIFIDLKGNVRYANYCMTSVFKKRVLSIPSRISHGYTPCLFEYIYLADEQSVIDGISVKRARELMGEILHEKIIRRVGNIDVIAPVPNTPVGATKRLAHLLNAKYTDLLYLPSMTQLYKNQNADELDEIANDTLKASRTFILPTKNKRELAVKDKFRINVDYILQCQGKILALVDDSIVRGTTMRIIVKMILELVQPRKLILISLAPPIRYENVFGIDIADRNSLIAHNRTQKEISHELGVDEIIYGDLDSITDAFKHEAEIGGVYVDGYESSVFKQNN